MGVNADFVTSLDDASDEGSRYFLEEVCVEIVYEQCSHGAHPESVDENAILLALFFRSAQFNIQTIFVHFAVENKVLSFNFGEALFLRLLQMIFCFFVVFVYNAYDVVSLLVEPILGAHVAKEWDERSHEADAWVQAT